jgi:outer membrane protein OmpA-like peptidoglycan-associated protein
MPYAITPDRLGNHVEVNRVAVRMARITELDSLFWGMRPRTREFNMGFNKLGMALFAAALAFSSSAMAQDDTQREGVILSQNGSNLSLRTREGPLNVVLSPTTEIRETAGIAQRRTRTAGSLMPGLIIKVHGTQAGNTLTADRVEYRERDWRSAVASAGGTQEALAAAAAERAAMRAETAELRNAIINGQEYVLREEVTVLFRSGSAAIAPEYQAQLRRIAQAAPGYGNYRFSIIGFADPRGNAAANERLSDRRATAVRNFLNQSGHIQTGRVLPAAPMGEGTTAAGETAPTSDAEARRVLVRLVTPKTQLTQ